MIKKIILGDSLSVSLELIRAIHNNLGTQLIVNTANRGAIRGLPDDAVIETNCIVDAQRTHPLGVRQTTGGIAWVDPASENL